MKKQISIMLAALLLTASLTIPASTKSVSDFTDVSPKAWYYGAVEYAANAGLFGLRKGIARSAGRHEMGDCLRHTQRFRRQA